MEDKGLARLWDGFECDFDSIFKDCLAAHGIDNALALVQKFTRSGPVLSQAQYARILDQLPQSLLQSPSPQLLRMLIHSQTFCTEVYPKLTIKFENYADLSQTQLWSMLHSISVLEASKKHVIPVLSLIEQRCCDQAAQINNTEVMHSYAALLANGPACDWYHGPEFPQLRKLFLEYDL